MSWIVSEFYEPSAEYFSLVGNILKISVKLAKALGRLNSQKKLRLMFQVWTRSQNFENASLSWYIWKRKSAYCRAWPRDLRQLPNWPKLEIPATWRANSLDCRYFYIPSYSWGEVKWTLGARLTHEISKMIDTIDGVEQIVIKPGTESDTQIRLSRKGSCKLGNKSFRGDHICHLQVIAICSVSSQIIGSDKTSKISDWEPA